MRLKEHGCLRHHRAPVPKTLPTLLFIVAAIVIAALIIKLVVGGRRRAVRYQLTPIMTGNEIEFFGRLRRALPDHHVFPQVAMSAVMRPLATFKQNPGAFHAISKKRIDYAVYDRAMALVALVELDDKMHNVERDAKRDAMTASAGVRTVRWNSKTKPSEQQIKQTLLAHEREPQS